MDAHDACAMRRSRQPVFCVCVPWPGELCISYGPLSNARLLMLYGFAIPDNPYGTLPFWVSMHEQVSRT